MPRSTGADPRAARRLRHQDLGRPGQATRFRNPGRVPAADLAVQRPPGIVPDEFLHRQGPHPPPGIAFTARDADVIKTYVRMGLGVGVLASMAVESGADDDLVAIDASGLLPRLTTWIGFDNDLPLKPSHRAFIQLLAPHLSDRQIDGRSGTVDIGFDSSELPLRCGPVAPLEMRGC